MLSFAVVKGCTNFFDCQLARYHRVQGSILPLSWRAALLIVGVLAIVDSIVSYLFVGGKAVSASLLGRFTLTLRRSHWRHV